MDRDFFSDRYGGKPYELYKVNNEIVMNLYINDKLCVKKIDSIQIIKVTPVEKYPVFHIMRIYYDGLCEEESMPITIVYQWLQESPELFPYTDRQYIEDMMKIYLSENNKKNIS